VLRFSLDDIFFFVQHRWGNLDTTFNGDRVRTFKLFGVLAEEAKDSFFIRHRRLRFRIEARINEVKSSLVLWHSGQVKLLFPFSLPLILNIYLLIFDWIQQLLIGFRKPLFLDFLYFYELSFVVRNVNLTPSITLLDIILDYVVSRLHVNPSPLGPCRQEVDSALQKSDLSNNVDHIELSLQLLHSFAFNSLLMCWFVSFLAKNQLNFRKVALEFLNKRNSLDRLSAFKSFPGISFRKYFLVNLHFAFGLNIVKSADENVLK